MTVLDVSLLSRLRRNHGLEHATLNLLSPLFPYRPLAGISTPDGFFIFGAVPTDNLREAVFQALERMNNGERRLAIHDHCGTNLVASGLVAGFLAWLGMAGARSRRGKAERLPLVIGLATLGFFVSQPLGPLLQERLTTSGDPEGLTVVDIFPVQFGRLVLHRVITRG